MDMGSCTVPVVGCALLAVVGGALTFFYRRRAIRYRAAFDRAFAIARRVYDFTDEETGEFTRLIGEPIHRDQDQVHR